MLAIELTSFFASRPERPKDDLTPSDSTPEDGLTLDMNVEEDALSSEISVSSFAAECDDIAEVRACSFANT